MSDADAGSFARFQAKGNLVWAATDCAPGRFEREVTHFASLVRDEYLYGLHTRAETVAERKDQIGYDLTHLEGLRSAGVHADAIALAEERRRLAAVADDSTITLDYNRERLAEIRLRQEYAIERVRATGAVIEVCPTSNCRIGGVTNSACHPVQRFIQSGLPVVVCSDDPGIFDSTLADELAWVCHHTGGGEDLWNTLVDTAWRSRAECLSRRTLDRHLESAP